MNYKSPEGGEIVQRWVAIHRKEKPRKGWHNYQLRRQIKQKKEFNNSAARVEMIRAKRD